MGENQVAKQIVDASLEVHRTLGGPGLLEKVYEEALARELTLRNLSVSRQQSVPVIYKGEKLSMDLRLDLVVEDKVIVEVKAVSAYNPIFESQLLTYLRRSGKCLGLVINFGEPLVKKGIHRVIHGTITE